MIFPRQRLALSVASAIVASIPALVQANTLEETVVIGSSIKQSETAAILLKRDSLNVVDAISADTIGRFPDQNLADSLARVPGIAIERDQGQARYVNLRGAPFRYTAIAFDGIDVPGAENGRIPRFDSFPVVITRQLTVNKAIMANMPGEAVSGFVNIETHSPFDQEGLGLALDLGTGEQELGGGSVNRQAFRASWSNNNFGVLAFASKNSRDQITDNREHEYDLDNGEKVPVEFSFRNYKIKRSDEAYGGTLEYRGDGQLQRLFASTLYSEFSDEEERNQYNVEFLNPTAGLTGQNAPMRVARLLENGVYYNSTFTNTLGSDFQFGGFEIQARYNYTETEFSQDLPITYQAAGFAGLTAQGPVPFFGSYDFTSETNPLIDLGADPDSAVFLANLGYAIYNPLDQKVNKFKLDLSRDLDAQTALALGMQFDQREAVGGALTAAIGSYPSDINPSDYNTGKLWDANTTNSIGGTYFDNIGLDNAWRASGQYPENDVSDNNVININEDILALYAMVTREFTWGNAVLGLRVEQAEVENIGGETRYTDDNTYYLPNAHININLTDSVKLRVSASTGVNRPTYNEWRATASINPIDQEINGGNPTLSAEESFGIDTSLEWYMSDNSLLSAAYFYRVVDNVIYADSSSVDAGAFLPGAAGEQWQYTGFVNGSDGTFSGLELNAILFLDELIKGVGVSANITFADSEFQRLDGTTVGLPGTSDMIYNAALFYENFGFSGRLNYSYRDEWISPIEAPDEVWGEMKRLDAQISYTLPFDVMGSEASVYANFNNITDETDTRYAGNGTINQSESFGMHYLIGLRINL